MIELKNVLYVCDWKTECIKTKIMNAKQLLLPRFEVIADYPKSTFENYKIRDVLELKEITSDKIFHNSDEIWVGNFFKQDDLEKFPHLFKRLNWWERRKEEDMPKKLMSLMDKDKENPEIYDIVKWDMINMLGFIDLETRSVCDLLIFNPEYSYIPID